MKPALPPDRQTHVTFWRYRPHHLTDPDSCKASGLTMIVAEQNVRFVSGLGDRGYILETGMVRYRGSMTEFLADDEVRQAYLAL